MYYIAVLGTTNYMSTICRMPCTTHLHTMLCVMYDGWRTYGICYVICYVRYTLQSAYHVIYQMPHTITNMTHAIYHCIMVHNIQCMKYYATDHEHMPCTICHVLYAAYCTLHTTSCMRRTVVLICWYMIYHMNVYVYIYTHKHMYIYIYIHI